MADAMTVNSTQSLADITGAQTQPGSSRLQQKTLGQDEFFKLLTTQLASQDPLKPMEDTAFIAQMASFSQLEMTSQLTKSFDNFTSIQQFSAAQSYLGHKVLLSDGTEGTVTSIEANDGEPLIMLDGSNVGTSIDKVNKVSL